MTPPAPPSVTQAANTYANCANCRHYRDNQCRNPASPYGGKIRLPGMGCWAGAILKSQVKHD